MFMVKFSLSAADVTTLRKCSLEAEDPLEIGFVPATRRMGGKVSSLLTFAKVWIVISQIALLMLGCFLMAFKVSSLKLTICLGLMGLTC